MGRWNPLLYTIYYILYTILHCIRIELIVLNLAYIYLLPIYIIANALRPRDVDDIHNYKLSNDTDLMNHVIDLMQINLKKLSGINNLKMKVDYIIFLK